jgi:hypothetical protein
LLGTLAMLLLYFPPLRHQLASPMPVADDVAFVGTRPLLGTLQKACADDPGIVLADTDISNLIRYYTECSVIANNFLLTPQHFEKVDEVQHLLTVTARELETLAPQIKYVLIRPRAAQPRPDGTMRMSFSVKDPRLANDLLLSPAANVPIEYTLLHNVTFSDPNQSAYARLYKIHHRAPAAPAPETTPAGSVVE